MYQLFTALMERFAPRIAALIAARARFRRALTDAERGGHVRPDRFVLAPNRAAVVFVTFVVAAWGWVSFRNLTVEAFPDPTDYAGERHHLFPGQPSEEVERQIGLPLERR
jgi:hypothetical protein